MSAAVTFKAAQERGEVARHGDNQHVRTADILPATLPDIGIPSQRAGVRP